MQNIKWFPFLLLVLALSSCRTTKPTIITEKSTQTITETLHDTIFLTQKDSSQYRALLDCIEGKVIIKQALRVAPGKVLNAPKVRVENNELTVDCEARAQELFASWKSKETSSTQIIEKPVFIEHPMTFWEKLQIYTGRILFCILILVIIYWLFKKYINAFGLKK